MKLYREVNKDEEADGRITYHVYGEIMADFKAKEVDLTDGDIDDIVNSIAQDDLYVEFGGLCAREAIMLLLSKLKGE